MIMINFLMINDNYLSVIAFSLKQSSTLIFNGLLRRLPMTIFRNTLTFCISGLLRRLLMT